MKLPNTQRGILEPPEMEELECLIHWPKGSVGEKQDREALKIYTDLCKELGFGRMRQLAEGVEQIWRNPEAVTEYEKFKKQHFENLGWENS
jgi:hypothetical protein